MIDIRSLLKRGTRSAADLREALAAIEHDAAATALAEAEAARRAALLDDDDGAVLKAEQRMATARIAVDRARAMDEELRIRIAEADSAEARAALDAERAAVEREAAATAKALLAYETHAAEIVKLLQRLQAAEDAVQAINVKLIEADREDERLAAVEPRAFPIAADLYSPLYSVLALTSLRPTRGQPGFGAGKRLTDLSGFKP